MNKDEVKNLANLSRIEISDDEAEKLTGEIDSILKYVDQIKEVATEDSSRIESAGSRNIMRPDENPHESSENTLVILEEVPEVQDDLVKVKKILNDSH
jgi:aspartyl-tRNA(Asn)/glutamyl-tRNA(Gln) amidotransferase subunit C